MEKKKKDRSRRDLAAMGYYPGDDPRKRRPRRLELSAMALHVMGLACLAAGGLSVALRVRFFRTGDAGGAIQSSELLALMEDPDSFALATVTILCQMAELCAIPIFAFLLTEGAVRTSSFGKYLLRVLGLAIVSEVPFSLLWNGAWFVAEDHNIVFGTMMALIMLWFFKTFPGKSPAHAAVKLMAVVGCFLWCGFLGIEHGAAMVLVTAALWAGRGRPNIQLLAGFAACVACVLLSPMYLIAALGLLPVHLYGGEKGRYNRWFVYLAYPIALLIFKFSFAV